jgi:hypothetical protein
MIVVEVTWSDAWVESGDMSVKQAKKSKPILTKTVGYMVANSKYGITVATDIYPKDKKNVKIVNFIPHGMIVEWHEYGEETE